VRVRFLFPDDRPDLLWADGKGGELVITSWAFDLGGLWRWGGSATRQASDQDRGDKQGDQCFHGVLRPIDAIRP
jgi:hypothetical protein